MTLALVKKEPADSGCRRLPSEAHSYASASVFCRRCQFRRETPDAIERNNAPRNADLACPSRRMPNCPSDKSAARDEKAILQWVLGDAAKQYGSKSPTPRETSFFSDSNPDNTSRSVSGRNVRLDPPLFVKTVWGHGASFD